MDAEQLLAPVVGLSLADAAQHYTGLGVPLFPCVPGEKRPLVTHGFQDATTDPGQIAAWWQRWPDANIGIPTGPASGLEVVDVDVKGDAPRGPESWQRATEAGLLDGWVAHVVTPSGGLHAYYPAAATEQRSWASGNAQLDFRGAAGYIIAPPSLIRIGGEVVAYQLLELSDGPARPVDAGALREFLDPRPPRAPWQSRLFRGSLEERTAHIAAWLSGRSENRNVGLYWASCRLAENGATLSEAFDALGPVAEDIGLPPREIERTIRSAYRGHAQPAPAQSNARQMQVRREPASRGRVLA